jgi:hypothetical protein
MQNSYKLVDASAEDLAAFKEGVDKLLEELSLNLSLTINKQPLTVKLEDGSSQMAFADQPSMVVQKRIEIEIVEKKKDEPDTKN